MSGLINKVKDAIHSDKKDNAATNNPHSDNAGPHGSNVMNSADPRVDSDRDNIHSTGHGTHGTTGGLGSTGTHGTTGGIGSTDPYGNTSGNYGGPGNPQSGNAGPHGSNLANKVDPRVDSDRDGGRNFGGSGTSGIGGASHGTHGTTGGLSSTGGNYGGPGNPQSGNAGPHGSNFANSADPRVDSDMDGGRHAGLGTSGVGHTSHTGQAGIGHGTSGHGTTGHSGPGGIGGAHSGAHSSVTPGSGNADKTAGPHNSDMLNKLDPRVDSDVDGSKTYGGNKTHQ